MFAIKRIAALLVNPSSCIAGAQKLTFAPSFEGIRTAGNVTNMAEFEVLLQPYKLEPSHASDDGYDCITIDINNTRNILNGLGGWKELNRVQSATKLYVRGSWESCFPPDSEQWCKDVAGICGLIKEITNLEELTYVELHAWANRIQVPFLERFLMTY